MGGGYTATELTQNATSRPQPGETAVKKGRSERQAARHLAPLAFGSLVKRSPSGHCLKLCTSGGPEAIRLSRPHLPSLPADRKPRP